MTAPHLLVLGRQGQLALSMARTAQEQGLSAGFAGRPDIDFSASGELEAQLDALLKTSPDNTVVINTVAYTDVAGAERDHAAAWAVNAQAPGILAQVCASHAVPLIHISTDYVFDGTRRTPYRETDPTGPETVYGQSKLDGEHAITAAHADHLILRTAWLFSPFGRNFLKTMAGLVAQDTDPVVVDDQQGCPTSALDLAGAIVRIAHGLACGVPDRGVFHYCGDTALSWHGFACRIFAVMAGPDAVRRVRATTGLAYDPETPRPAWSVLDCQAIERTFGVAQPSLDAAIERDLTLLEQSRR